jgi:hypothetical protein
MDWDQQQVDRLDAALKESTVCGIDYISERDEARLLVDVCSLPFEGPMDADPRRVLILNGVGALEVVLRTDRASWATTYGPPIPLAAMADVTAFIRSLTWLHPMYGWKFIDTEGFRVSWPSAPSLAVEASPAGCAHSLYWFTECGRLEAREHVAYCLEGVVHFDELRVERADGSHVSAVEFAQDGLGWWTAFNQRDPRVSVEAQRRAAASGLSWKPRNPSDGSGSRRE